MPGQIVRRDEILVIIRTPAVITGLVSHDGVWGSERETTRLLKGSISYLRKFVPCNSNLNLRGNRASEVPSFFLFLCYHTEFIKALQYEDLRDLHPS